MIKKIPAPWILNGNGYIFLYKFPKRMRNKKYFGIDFADNKSFSGFGSMMLVDYLDSTGGPYKELLFIPGSSKYKKKKIYSITKIYVSTEVSVKNGIENWGIPKELAEYTFTQFDNNREQIVIKKNKDLIMDITLKSYKFQFPITTRLIPYPIAQKAGKKIFFTKFLGKGKGRFSKIESIYINSKFFPDISEFKPIAVVRVKDFKIEFPVAKVEKT